MDQWKEYGSALYMLLLHGNFLHEPPAEKRRFSTQFRRAANALDSRELARWLNAPWRERLTAAWITAARRDESVRDQITTRLLASETCFAGQGLCVATARYQDHAASDTLTAYLTQYLPVGERQYDQEWAIGSLVWLDEMLGTNHADKFLSRPELWKVYAYGKEAGALNPQDGIEVVAQAMQFLNTDGTATFESSGSEL